MILMVQADWKGARARVQGQGAQGCKGKRVQGQEGTKEREYKDGGAKVRGCKGMRGVRAQECHGMRA